jgi:hypothetical protein
MDGKVYEVVKSPFSRTKQNPTCSMGPLDKAGAGVAQSVTEYRLDDLHSIPGRGKQFFLWSVSIPALRLTQPPIQWVPGVIPGGKAWPGSDAYYSRHLVARSRMSTSCTSSSPWRLHGGSRTALDKASLYYQTIMAHLPENGDCIPFDSATELYPKEILPW